jgi:hypothetical protein
VAAGAHAQQSDQMRRIGVMMAFAEDDPEALLRITTLREELLKLGWTEGRNRSLTSRLVRAATQSAVCGR